MAVVPSENGGCANIALKLARRSPSSNSTKFGKNIQQISAFDTVVSNLLFSVLLWNKGTFYVKHSAKNAANFPIFASFVLGDALRKAA